MSDYAIPPKKRPFKLEWQAPQTGWKWRSFGSSRYATAESALAAARRHERSNGWPGAVFRAHNTAPAVGVVETTIDRAAKAEAARDAALEALRKITRTLSPATPTALEEARAIAAAALTDTKETG